MFVFYNNPTLEQVTEMFSNENKNKACDFLNSLPYCYQNITNRSLKNLIMSNDRTERNLGVKIAQAITIAFS